MKAKIMILIVLVAALSAPIATACPPCDEPWTGTKNCTPQDRFWYCCIHTDQCYLDGPFDPWPVWQLAEADATERACEPHLDAKLENTEVVNSETPEPETNPET